MSESNSTDCLGASSIEIPALRPGCFEAMEATFALCEAIDTNGLTIADLLNVCQVAVQDGHDIMQIALTMMSVAIGKGKVTSAKQAQPSFNSLSFLPPPLWLDGKPQEPGIYWYVTKRKREIYEVFQGDPQYGSRSGLYARCVGHSRGHNFQNWSGWWAGPVPPPMSTHDS